MAEPILPMYVFEEMSGLEKTALLLNILGTQVTGQIFKKMKDNIKRIVSAMERAKAPIGRAPVA